MAARPVSAKRTLLLGILAMFVLVGLSGCGAVSGGGGGGSPPEVRVVPDDPVPDEEGRIVLPPGPEELQPGSGLITGNGTHLYKVEDVEVMPDGSLRITTSQGSLAQLGIAGEFRFVDPPGMPLPGKYGPQLLGPDVNLQILDVSMPFSTTINLTNSGSVTATVDGVFELEGVFHLAFDVGLFSGLRTFSSYIGGDASLDLNASVEARSGASISREVAVTEAFRTYYHGVIGAPPYYILVEVTSQLFAGFEGNVEAGASLETGVYADASAKAGASYDSSRAVGSRWSTIAASGFEWGYDQPVVCFDGSGSLRAYLRPHFEVQLYSALGPTFDIEPYARLDASIRGCLGDAAAEYDVTLTAGAVGYARIKADILDLFVLESPSLTVFDVSRELMRWQNTPPPLDSDGDGVPNSADGCPNDRNKTSPGVCGCGRADTDSDRDGTADCIDGCPNDGNKTSPGNCGCGNAEVPGCSSTYDLTASAVGSGSVSPSSGSYAPGTVVTLTASTSMGWHFDHWEGDASGTSPTTTLTMSRDRNAVAVFEPDNDEICTADEHCRDEFFCNGQERCVNGLCIAGANPCPPGQTCNDATDTCAGAVLGSIVAWGWNGSAQSYVPVPNVDFIGIAAGVEHGLGLKSDGSIVAWGSCGGAGECNVPAPNTGFVAVEGGWAHSLGLKADGSIVAWGINSAGQLNVPAPNSGFIAVAAGADFSLGLKADGSIVAWGNNDNGQLNVPTPNSGFIAVAAGCDHSLGLKADSSVVTWGYNADGTLNVPSPNTGFVAIAAGCPHSLGLRADGSIVAWGRNSYGQLNVPAPNSGFVAVAAGLEHSLGLKADGSIAAWGYNDSGQLNVPAPNNGFIAVAAGNDHSLGLKAD